MRLSRPAISQRLCDQARSNLRKIECLPVEEIRNGLTGLIAQPIEQIGKNGLRMRRPRVALNVADLHAEAAEFKQDMRNIVTCRLGCSSLVPADWPKQLHVRGLHISLGPGTK